MPKDMHRSIRAQARDLLLSPGDLYLERLESFARAVAASFPDLRILYRGGILQMACSSASSWIPFSSEEEPRRGTLQPESPAPGGNP